jgi:hypothetical protein
VTSRATTRISSRPIALRSRVMRVEVDAAIVATTTSGSNAGLAREQAAFVAHGAAEAEKLRFVNSPTLQWMALTWATRLDLGKQGIPGRKEPLAGAQSIAVLLAPVAG